MFEVKEDSALGKGTWRLFKGGRRSSVLFSCPRCGKINMLKHTIRADGVVSLPARCLKPGCPFSEIVRLVGWKSESSKSS